MLIVSAVLWCEAWPTEQTPFTAGYKGAGFVFVFEPTLWLVNLDSVANVVYSQRWLIVSGCPRHLYFQHSIHCVAATVAVVSFLLQSFSVFAVTSGKTFKIQYLLMWAKQKLITPFVIYLQPIVIVLKFTGINVLQLLTDPWDVSAVAETLRLGGVAISTLPFQGEGVKHLHSLPWNQRELTLKEYLNIRLTQHWKSEGGLDCLLL